MDLRSPYLFHPGPPKNPRPLDEAVGACAGKHLEDWPEWADWPEGDVGALRGLLGWDPRDGHRDCRWGHPVVSHGDPLGMLWDPFSDGLWDKFQNARPFLWHLKYLLYKSWDDPPSTFMDKDHVTTPQMRRLRTPPVMTWVSCWTFWIFLGSGIPVFSKLVTL